MEKVALRAEYKTDTIINEGYICIQENDDRTKMIDGFFGLDYVRINFIKKDVFNLVLLESIYTIKDKRLYFFPKLTVFTSQILYVPDICCPEQYLLGSKKGDMMSLSLLEKETNPAKVKEIFEDLLKLRP